MTVSVIIPCYNAERFLTEAVESALSQSFRDIQIILVDDGSADGTPEVIRSFGSSVQALFSDHRGASAARNLGTRRAEGGFIQYLDADDLLWPDAVEKRVGALERTGADVAYSDWQRWQEDGEGRYRPGAVISRRLEDIHRDPEIALFTDFWAPPAAILYRKSIVERIGAWNESLPVIQDARFLLDAALRGGRFVHVSGVGADYRRPRNETLSRRDSAAFVTDVFLNACQIEEEWSGSGGITQERGAALVKVYGFVCRASFEKDRGTFEKARCRLERREPGYVPSSPIRLAMASRVLGYDRAEHLAFWYRKIKKLVVGS